MPTVEAGNIRVHERLPVFLPVLVTVLAAIGMLGCATLAPRYATPPLPVAPQYPEDAAEGQGRAEVTKAWKDYFADPQLEQLITSSLENNRDLRIAVQRVEEARATYRVRRADQLPTVNLGVDVTRSHVPYIENSSQIAVNVSGWELDFWGRVRSLKEEALQSYLATEEARRAITVSLIADVADTWFAVRELDQRIVLARRALSSRQESFRIFTRRFEVGSTSRLDLMQVETLLRQAQSLDAQLEQERALRAHTLTLLVGASVTLPVAQEFEFDPAMLPELRAGLPSDLLATRPDIAEAEHALRAAHANIGAARAAFFPRVTLTGSGGTASVELAGLISTPGLFSAGSGAWNFLPSISLPIFDGGRNRNNLKLAEAQRNSALADYEKSIQTAFRDVSDALSNQHWLTEQVAIQKGFLGVQTERARLASMRYENGSASFLEVLDAQRDTLSAEQDLVELQRSLLSSRVRLYAALGGGA